MLEHDANISVALLRSPASSDYIIILRRSFTSYAGWLAYSLWGSKLAHYLSRKQAFPADCLHANIFTLASNLHSKPSKAQSFQHIANFSMIIADQSPPFL